MKYMYQRKFIGICITLFMAATDIFAENSPDIATHPDTNKNYNESLALNLKPSNEIRIFRKNNRIFLPIRDGNGKRQMMLFDTGATTTVFFTEDEDLSPEQANVKLVNFPALNIKTYGRAATASGITIKGQKIPPHEVIHVRRSMVGEIEPEMFFDGILGQHLLTEYIVEIDVKKQRMTLWDKKTPISHRFSTERNITSDQGRPVILLEAEFPWDRRERKQRLMLDSGYAGSMVIWQTPKFVKKISNILYASDRNRNYAMIMDMGFSGAKLKRAPVFVMKRDTHAEQQDGIIGMAMMSMFHFAIDMERGKLYLNKFGSYNFELARAIEILRYAPNETPVRMINLTPRIAECMRSACLSNQSPFSRIQPSQRRSTKN